ncbi:DUF1552 domain-containing protein [Frigoriglobus tundricola]|uniref:DUF1552 domain-containing protein n=1 Tax=Frigoriglobus tundricola TaxID=2774151 RepID=A0A6M5Z2D5_9BACT|nr:DUF1552 domain-containing protein [Frigoriglobus tundricola]QJX00570.1 hypothetical protein FTUN_8200 [Frigoriglobus tundricola]
MPVTRTRREFVRDLGISAAAVPFLLNLPGLSFANQAQRKQRIVFIFSPNGIVPKSFWPDEEGAAFKLKEILTPLELFKKQTLTLHGVCDKIRGDGDGHMRGIGCLLTGIELFPGNIQGGSDTPAGWAKGISIDQEIRNHLQKSAATKTRFGSLELGVMVPERADTWTRWSYAGANKPLTPIDDPYQLFNKLYGRAKDNEALASVLDDVKDDLKKVGDNVGAADKKLLEEHAAFVRDMEKELKESRAAATAGHAVPKLEPGMKKVNDNMPQVSKAQIDLLVNSFSADFARVATYQITNSVGEPRMKWLGIDEGHHGLSHEPDTNEKAQEKLVKINKWYCEQVAYLAKRLAETPEPGGSGNLLDNTLLVWTNELGKGNSHTMDNIPFVLVGGGLDFKMGRSLKFPKVAHNRLLMALAHGFGHEVKTFGNPNHCAAGPLTGLV